MRAAAASTTTTAEAEWSNVTALNSRGDFPLRTRASGVADKVNTKVPDSLKGRKYYEPDG